MANAGTFRKGEKRPNQGKRGPNKLTLSVKEAFEAAFRKAQGIDGVKLEDWMTTNPDDFYKICAKLIPSEIKGAMTHTHNAPALEVVAAALGLPKKD